MRDKLITAREAEMLAPGLDRHTVYRWATRGQLAPVAHRGRSPLYRLADVLDCERRTRGNRQSCRHPDRQRAAARLAA